MNTLTISTPPSRVRCVLGKLVTLTTLSITLMSTSAATFVRPEPGSPKTLLYVDGNQVFATQGGKLLMTIDDQRYVCAAPSGKKLYFVAHGGEVHRETEQGIQVGYWEGGALLKKMETPRLLILGRYAEEKQDVSLGPKKGEPRLFCFEGMQPNMLQLTAIIHLLKPELFAVSDKEVAEATQATAAAAEKKQRAAAPEAQAGNFTVTELNGPWKFESMAITPVNGHLHFDAKGTTPLSGMGVKFQYIGSDHVVGAAGSATSLIGVFEYKNGSYSGGWSQASGKGALQKDSWTTAQSPLGEFSSKSGKLKFTYMERSLKDEGSVYSVVSESGLKGYAYKYNDAPEASGLVIALGEGAGVFRMYANGNRMMGDYQGGPGNRCYFAMQR